MADREIDGFIVWAGAHQNGDDQPRAQVETKPLDGSGKTRTFTVITTKRFASLDAAMAAAHEAVQAVESVNDKGVPHPLTYEK